MIEKDKTYTYEELKEIMPKACAEVTYSLSKEMETVTQDADFLMMMTINNLLLFNKLNSVLFGKKQEKKEEN